MTIKSGLQEGEIVVLNPRGFPDKLTLPEVLDERPMATQVRPPQPPQLEGEEKPKDRPPDDPPGPRPAAPGGAS
jgi:hypothetical protein